MQLRAAFKQSGTAVLTRAERPFNENTTIRLSPRAKEQGLGKNGPRGQNWRVGNVTDGDAVPNLEGQAP